MDNLTGRPDRSELNSGSLNIINAGADLFAGVLAAAFFYLLHNQCALRKATKEIREMFSTPSEICSGPKLNSCVYLQACIEETLRLAPLAPSHLPREVLLGGIDIYGHHIPGGMVVAVPAYSIHHNIECYPDPW